MKLTRFQIVLALLLAAIAGYLGALAADHWNTAPHESGLHGFVHNELALTAEQEAKLEVIENRFATEQRQLELASRSANVRLAQAMEQEHEYGPEVAAAIDAVHEAMGDLQKATVRHVFAMRSILSPAQQVKFDQQVSGALTRDPRE